MSISSVTQDQFKKMRLLLSTYQDGSGRSMHDRTLFNWEDFEDVTEVVFCGKRLKSKSVFDVIVPNTTGNIGISCKITKTLKQSDKTVLIEHSRVNAQFFDELRKRNLYGEEIFKNPTICGEIIINLINKKHELEAQASNIDLHKSFFLVLVYDFEERKFKVFQFPVKLPRLDKFTWSFSDSNKCLKGKIGDELVIQHFPDSSGQLKYYPHIRKSIWFSEIFSLEPLKSTTMKNIEEKMQEYFSPGG